MPHTTLKIQPINDNMGCNAYIFIMALLFAVLAIVYFIKQYRVAIKSCDLVLDLAYLETPTLSGFGG
jgi:hypothetical protein